MRHLRAATALAAARPAYAAGIRAAFATVVPLVAGLLWPTGGGTWMSLAGFNGALADRGGPYRARALTMSVMMVASALAAWLGTLSARSLPVALGAVFLMAVLSSVARVWGSSGATVGTSVLNLFVIALTLPPSSVDEAVARAGFAVVGGLWAMLLSLVVWPLRPYRPVRLAVAECYRAVAGYVEGLVRRVDDPSDAIRRNDPAAGVRVRNALEVAGAALTATRRGRAGTTGRGERLVVLRETADQLVGVFVALFDTVDALPIGKRVLAAAVLGETLSAAANTVLSLAEAVLLERGAPVVPVDWSGAAVRNAAGAETGSEREHLLEAAVLLDRAAQYAAVAAETVATLNDGGPAALPDESVEERHRHRRESVLAPLGDILAEDSVILRYAFRLAAITTLAVWLTAALDLKRGYWVTITIIVIMQPYTGATTLKALQRVLGTVAGGVITAGLGALFHDTRAVLPLTFVCAAAAVALLPVNYAAASMFFTPAFVLLAEAGTGDWHLAGVRIVNTLIGGGLALLGARLLWHAPEWRRLSLYMAGSLRAHRDYLSTVLHQFDDRSAAAGRTLRAARRRVGLAATNAEESFQRALGEHRGPPEMWSPVMTFLTYNRRLIASTAALAVARHSMDDVPPEALHRFEQTAAAVLDDLARAVEERRAPAPLPPVRDRLPVDPHLPSLLQIRFDRVNRQVATLHDAVDHWARNGYAPGTAPNEIVGPLPATES